MWIIFTSFILVGRCIRGRAQSEPRVHTRGIWAQCVFIGCSDPTVTWAQSVFIGWALLGPKCDWAQTSNIGILVEDGNPGGVCWAQNGNSILGTKSTEILSWAQNQRHKK